jgi:hypothetical protein
VKIFNFVILGFTISETFLNLVPCTLYLILILQVMTPVFKIGNSEELNSSQAVLLMEIGETHCCFAILDYANQMIVQSGCYTFNENESSDILQKVLQEHNELKNSFRQIVIGYYLPENILIPSKFYRYEETQTLLQAMYEKGQNIVVSEAVPKWQLHNAYHVPAAIHQLVNRSFATGNFWHIHSIILKNGIEEHEGGNLIIDFKTDSFCVIAIKDNSVLFAQIFPYVKAEDILYWLLNICKQFSLAQTAVKLVLSGLIEKKSAIFKELYQYFLNIEFASGEDDIRLSGDFYEYPAHFFSSLFKLALCVS